MSTDARPQFRGFHHYASAVADLATSAAWYERVLGLTRTAAACPTNGAGEGVLLSDPDSGVLVQLQPAGSAQPPGHTAFAVASRAQLDSWARWLDGLGVAHGGVVDVVDPEPYAFLVFRDPDDVPLVLVHTVR
ncbi:VOC family protein [Actinomycetospora sp. C-140]